MSNDLISGVNCEPGAIVGLMLSGPEACIFRGQPRSRGLVSRVIWDLLLLVVCGASLLLKQLKTKEHYWQPIVGSSLEPGATEILLVVG
jgi:hypothetical protein